MKPSEDDVLDSAATLIETTLALDIHDFAHELAPQRRFSIGKQVIRAKKQCRYQGRRS